MQTAQTSELLNTLLATLDLDDFEDVPTGTLTVLHPKLQAPTSSKIVLAGKEHPERKKIDMARTRKLRNAFAATGKMPVTDPLEEFDDETDYLVANTLDWTLTKGSEPLPFSKEAARALYTDPKRQWIRAQVAAGLNKSELFIASSVKP